MTGNSPRKALCYGIGDLFQALIAAVQAVKPVIFPEVADIKIHRAELAESPLSSQNVRLFHGRDEKVMGSRKIRVSVGLPKFRKHLRRKQLQNVRFPKRRILQPADSLRLAIPPLLREIMKPHVKVSAVCVLFFRHRDVIRRGHHVPIAARTEVKEFSCGLTVIQPGSLIAGEDNFLRTIRQNDAYAFSKKCNALTQLFPYAGIYFRHSCFIPLFIDQRHLPFPDSPECRLFFSIPLPFSGKQSSPGETSGGKAEGKAKSG